MDTNIVNAAVAMMKAHRSKIKNLEQETHSNALRRVAIAHSETVIDRGYESLREQGLSPSQIDSLLNQ